MKSKVTTSRGSRRSTRRQGRKKPGKVDAPRVRSDALPRAIMVLGMHRSGTSAITRVIGLLGADLPKNLMPANPINESGYWESDVLMAIHNELLSSGGSKWDDWRAFNADWYESPAAGIFKSRVLEVLRNDFAMSQLFSIKDPRICRFWPFWREVLDEFGAKPGVVIPVRNPLEVAASLKRGYGFLPAKSCLLWLRHVLDAETATRDVPRAIVDYHALLEDWQSVVATLRPRLGVHWPRRGAMAEVEIERFLSTHLRHHVIASGQLAAKAEVVDWVKEAHAALIQMTVVPEHKASMARLDRIRTEFEKASMAFGVALADGEMELAKRVTENAQLQGAHEALQQRISHLADEQQRLSADAENAAGVLRAELDSALTALSAERGKAAAQTDRVTDLEMHLSIAEASHAAAVEEVRQLRSEREALLAAERQKVVEQAQRLTVTEEVQRTAEAKHAAVALEVRQLSTEREALRQRISDLTREQARIRADAEERAAQLKGDLETAQAKLSAERQKLAEQTDQINDLLEHQKLTEANWIGVLQETRLIQAELTGRANELEGALFAERKAAVAGAAAQKSERVMQEAEIVRLREELSAVVNHAERLEASLNSAKSITDSTKNEPRANTLAPNLRPLRPIRWIRCRLQERKNRKLIAGSGLFDRNWYLENYPDVRSSGLDPVVHYLQHGVAEGRDPSPLFDSDWYLQQNPDVRAAGINPLIHYVQHGVIEGRDPYMRARTSSQSKT